MHPDRLTFRQIRRTTAFRLTVALGTTFAAGLLLLIGLVYLMTTRELIARSDRILHAEAVRLLASSAAGLPERVTADVAHGAGFSYLELISGDGERIAGNIAFSGPLPLRRPIELASMHGPLRLIAVRTATGETILVGRDISQVSDLRRRLLLILATSGIAILMGVSTAATLMAVPPLRRVRDLDRAARHIAAGRLEVRMPIAGRHDELDQFATTVNAMVEAVGRTVAQVKSVTDAIAHDLRTPLTHVRATLDHAGALPDLPARVAAAFDGAIGDLDLVLARFAALLRISEIEAGARRSGFARVALTDLLAGVHALYEPLAEERGIVLLLGPMLPITIEGDGQLLFEALSNLVDNAIKFAADEAVLSVRTEGASTVFEVRDDGPGIPADEREAVLRRFYRGRNAAEKPGTGLGLPIVAAIAHLHGHDLVLADAQPGLVARVVIGSR